MATKELSSSERPVCAICIEKIQPEDNVSKLNCDHKYHKDCLQPWLDARQNTCPLDREKITSINGIPFEQPEKKVSVHQTGLEWPLEEDLTLYQRNIRVTHNHSQHLGSSHETGLERPSDRARALYQRNIEVIYNHSQHLGSPYETVLESPLEEARALYQRSIGMTHNVSQHLGSPYETGSERPSDRAQALYQRNVEVIHNHSRHLGNTMEQTTANTQSLFFSMFSR